MIAVLTFIAVLLALIIALAIVGVIIQLLIYLADNHETETAFTFLAVIVVALAFFITKEVIR